MRLISVNGETAVHHVDERPWKCTIRLLSGSKVPTDFLQIWFFYGLVFANLCENKAVAVLEEGPAWNDSS